MNNTTEPAGRRPLPAHLQALVGQAVDAVDTPALVVDLDAMERNLTRMAEFAAKHQIRWRPHAKMHKSAGLARLQMQAGAVGVCVQKTAEAEAMVAGGVPNVYISNEVIAPAKLARVAALALELAGKGGQLSLAVDSLLGVERLVTAVKAVSPGRTPRALVDVYVEIDVGHGRCGIAPGAPAVALAQAVATEPLLRFAGLQAYHGKAQHLRTVQERRAAIAAVVERVQATRAALESTGLSR
jgi:D-serine deaminase-like pyridoxal phosphate-dependent protein